MVRNVEWIGAKSPLQDDRVNFRLVRGLYTDEEEVVLEVVADIVAPLIRQANGTSRRKTEQDGYSKEYRWRWRTNRFICEMTDLDAERLFKHDPDEAQFRDLEYHDPELRKPKVPWYVITAALHKILIEAENGPPVVKIGEKRAMNLQAAARLVDEWRDQQREEAGSRGWIWDPAQQRLVRPE